MMLLGGYGCSSKTDSAKQANETNETRTDNQATDAMSGSKNDAEDTSEGLVELADMGMTEHELSKLAVERAVSPEIKAYAKEVVSDHEKDQAALGELAKSMNFTLATTLSKEGNDRVDNLRKQVVAKEFDKQYLSQMQQVNNRAIQEASDIERDTKNDALKTYVGKVKTDDAKHSQRAADLVQSLNNEK